MQLLAKEQRQVTPAIATSSVKARNAEVIEATEASEEEPSYLGDKIACVGLLLGALIMAGKTLIDFLVGMFR